MTPCPWKPLTATFSLTPCKQNAWKSAHSPGTQSSPARFFEDMKLEEIAAIMHMNLSTVKSRLYKALKLLRLDLEEE